MNVLYQSSQCKVRILCFRDRPREHIEIDVSYGKLHAPVNEEVIDWNGEKSYCWHSIISAPILNFLGGMSPAEAVNLGISNTFRDFLRMSKGKDWTIPERFSREQEFIWDYCGLMYFQGFSL